MQKSITMDSEAVVEIIEKAKSLPDVQAISYLINNLEGFEGICFECLDKLLVNYKSDRESFSPQTFSEQCMICALLHENNNDGYV